MVTSLATIATLGPTSVYRGGGDMEANGLKVLKYQLLLVDCFSHLHTVLGTCWERSGNDPANEPFLFRNIKKSHSRDK